MNYIEPNKFIPKQKNDFSRTIKQIDTPFLSPTNRKQAEMKIRFDIKFA